MSKSEKSSISIERNKNWFGKGRPANVIVNKAFGGRPLDYWFTMNDTYDNGNECHEKPE